MRTFERLSAPLFVAWQLTRDCDLCCLHCCTDSAPGKPFPDELTAAEAIRLVDDIVANEVPYVMLCGGEPFVVPHFLAAAERLGGAGVKLKIETNGQKLDGEAAARLARLPIRSIQVSLDGDSEDVYRRQRPGGSLAKAHAACQVIREAGMPLEVTFAPTRINLHEAPRVIARARALGAFRFNTGKLMRVGTAARLWDRLEPSAGQYEEFLALLAREAGALVGEMEICYSPFTLEEGLARALDDPPATMLVLPNGVVKVAAAVPHVCADLRQTTLAHAWQSYRQAWSDAEFIADVHRAIAEPERHAEANNIRRIVSFANV